MKYFYLTQTGTTTLGQSELESNNYQRVLPIPQSSRTGASPSDGLVSYPGHLLGEFYLSAVLQSAYSTAAANKAKE